MWPRLPLVIVIPLVAIVLAVSYVTYRLVDPLPPRHLAIAAGMAGSGYDNFARQYARILARDGVGLEGGWRSLYGYPRVAITPGRTPQVRASVLRLLRPLSPTPL